MDGKTVRGSKNGAISPLHRVSAYATSLGLTLCQEGVASKGNELKAIRALLDVRVLKGCLVTVDALGCQTDRTAAITGKGGDYVLAVKGNQKILDRRDFPGRRLPGAQGLCGAQSFSRAQINFAMLRLDTAYPKSSLRQRRNRASRKPLYREELIGLRPGARQPTKHKK